MNKEKPFSLQESLAREEEIQDWNEYLGGIIARCSHELAKPEVQNDNAEFKRWRNLQSEAMKTIQRNYGHAEESELGREALREVRARKKRGEDYIAEFSRNK